MGLQFITGILSHASAQAGTGESFNFAGESVYKPPDISNWNDFSNDVRLNGDKLLFPAMLPSLGTSLCQSWNFFFNFIEGIPFWRLSPKDRLQNPISVGCIQVRLAYILRRKNCLTFFHLPPGRRMPRPGIHLQWCRYTAPDHGRYCEHSPPYADQWSQVLSVHIRLPRHPCP